MQRINDNFAPAVCSTAYTPCCVALLWPQETRRAFLEGAAAHAAPRSPDVVWSQEVEEECRCRAGAANFEP